MDLRKSKEDSYCSVLTHHAVCLRLPEWSYGHWLRTLSHRRWPRQAYSEAQKVRDLYSCFSSCRGCCFPFTSYPSRAPLSPSIQVHATVSCMVLCKLKYVVDESIPLIWPSASVEMDLWTRNYTMLVSIAVTWSAATVQSMTPSNQSCIQSGLWRGISCAARLDSFAAASEHRLSKGNARKSITLPS